MLRRYFFAPDPARRRWRRADPFPWAKSPRRSQPMAATALAPPIRLPFRQFLTEKTLRRRALALPLPASILGCLLRKERRGGGRRLSPSPLRLPLSTASRGKNAAAAGGACVPSAKDARPSRAKEHLPIYNITCKNEKERPSRAKNIPCHKASPSNNKKQAADSGEKRSSPLPDGRHKKQKNRTPDLDVLQVWMRQQPNLPWGDPKVLSAQESLTSVFGMRTGGSSPLSSPQWLYNPHALAHGFIYKL